jgi:hypothetical protein
VAVNPGPLPSGSLKFAVGTSDFVTPGPSQRSIACNVADGRRRTASVVTVTTIDAGLPTVSVTGFDWLTHSGGVIDFGW